MSYKKGKGSSVCYTGGNKFESALGIAPAAVQNMPAATMKKGHTQGSSKEVSSQIEKLNDMHKMTKMPLAKAQIED